MPLRSYRGVSTRLSLAHWGFFLTGQESSPDQHLSWGRNPTSSAGQSSRGRLTRASGRPENIQTHAHSAYEPGFQISFETRYDCLEERVNHHSSKLMHRDCRPLWLGQVDHRISPTCALRSTSSQRWTAYPETRRRRYLTVAHSDTKISHCHCVPTANHFPGNHLRQHQLRNFRPSIHSQRARRSRSSRPR